MSFNSILKQSFLVFFLAIIVQQGYGQCPSYQSFDTQEEIDNFPTKYPDCTVITIGLKISGNIENLIGLANVTAIEGDLIIIDAPNLTSLSGLDNLTNVEVLALVNLENLADMSSLENLKSAELITIKETAIKQLPSFSNLEELSVAFWIHENHQLNEVHFPDNIAFDGQVEVVRNSGIKSITGFNGMKSSKPKPFWSIMIRGNENLETIEGFENLETSDDIIINSNNNLRIIPMFPMLATCEGGIDINSNPKLTEIKGFNELVTSEVLVFRFNNLEIIDGFEKLEETENLHIVDEVNLKTLSSFPNLKRAGRLSIRDSKLETITGFNNLDTVEYDLIIANNDLLTEIDGLNNLRMAGNLSVHSNPLLSDCLTFCNYRSIANEELWAYFNNNASGCNSLQEVNDSCNDTIGEVQVFDVILNTFSGSHTIDELEDVSLEIYEGDELILSYFSDLEGLVEIDLNKLDSTKKYRIEAYLGVDAVVKMKYDDLTLEMLSSDDITIEYPNRLMDSIVSYRDKLEERVIPAPFLGQAVSYNYTLNGYEMNDVDAPINDFIEISMNHEDVVESMKRMGLGLYAMNVYLDDGIMFSNSMAKAFTESTFGLYKFVKEMNSLQSVVDNISEEIAGEAANKAMKAANLAASKFVYDWIKRFYINGKIAALENNPDSKDLGKSIKQYLNAVEAAIFKGDALTETVFQEIIFNLAGKYVAEQYFIQSATQDQLNGLGSSHENIDIGFPFLVDNMNTFRAQSEVSNNSAITNADFYSGFSQDVGNLGALAENVGLGVTVFSLGTGAPLGESLRKFGQGLKAGSLSLNGFNFLTYSYRLTSLPSELFEITSQFELNPPYESGQYSAEFLAALISELNLEIVLANMLLEDYKTAVINNDLSAANKAYLKVADFTGSNYKEKLGSLISVISNMGSVAHLNGDPDEDFLAIEGKFRQLEAEKFVLDLNMMAYIVDSNNDTIVNELIAEIDTLQLYMNEIGNVASSFFSDNASAEFPPLISISSIIYPDTFLMAPFIAKIKIQNVGPLTSDPFSVLLTPNEHCTLNLLESQLESLVLESGETRTFEVEITPLTENQSNSIFLEFIDVRGIDESIVFSFQDQILDFGGSTKTDDLIQSKIEGISFPNPSNGIINIKEEFLVKVDEYKIYDLSGMKVKSGNLNTNWLNIKDLPAGVYIISFNGDNVVFTEKIIRF